jgi:hypothetical protein
MGGREGRNYELVPVVGFEKGNQGLVPLRRCMKDWN